MASSMLRGANFSEGLVPDRCRNYTQRNRFQILVEVERNMILLVLGQSLGIDRMEIDLGWELTRSELTRVGNASVGIYP